MNLPLLLLRRLPTRRRVVGGVVVALFTLVGVVLLARLVEWRDLGTLIEKGWADPTGLLIALGGFGSAFVVRGFAGSRLLPGLRFGQALAAVHVALGANHVLPLRLGEPLRIVSVIARTRVPVGPATASGVALRFADVAALLLIGAALGPRAFFDAIGIAGGIVAAVVSVATIIALVVVARMSIGSNQLRAPDGLTAVLTVGAWCLEALLVLTVAGWGGVELSYSDALLVTVVAVASQMVAIAPGGVGTYEAAAVSALVLVGADADQALVIALAAHGLKTLYSVVLGLVFLAVPGPGLLTSLRLSKDLPTVPNEPASDGPVVFFLPAFQEGPRIADVLARIPETVSGRPVHKLVIDDGSTDSTVRNALDAGAVVHSLDRNRGLGRAVAVGFERATADFGAAAVAFCDADGEYDPAELEALVEPILEGQAHYVVGSRFAGTIRHMRPHRRFGNQTLTAWVRWVTRTPVTDGQSGYRVLSRRAALASEMAHDYNYAQVLTIDLLQKGFGYHEVPIDYRFRDSGDSFIRLGTYLRTVVPTVLRLVSRPSSSSVSPADSSIDLRASVLDDVPFESVQSP